MRKLPTAQTTLALDRDVYTVDRLNRTARQLVESRFAQVWVEGEISSMSAPTSGHLYFTLKDDAAQIRCAFFRTRRAALEYSPVEGAQVLMRARLTIYEPRGDLQLVVQHIEPAGEGALRLKFEKLKQKLKTEGLFDVEQKRPLPRIPNRIGIISSPTGAAVRDIITTCRRRFAGIPLVIYPTPVQGEFAEDGLVQSLQLASDVPRCDVLILARGGGSLEDLWAFNEERVARAMYTCTVPIVTGIGHETDFTIADLVADQRGATPTAAAQIVAPDASAIQAHVCSLQMQLLSLTNRKLEQLAQRNDLLSHRLIHPTRRYAHARNKSQLLYSRLCAAIRAELTESKLGCTARSQRLFSLSPDHRLRHARWRMQTVCKQLVNLSTRLTKPPKQRLQTSLTRLNAVSPLATLDRGYALVTDPKGKIVSGMEQVATGSKVDVQLAHGRLDCRVEGKSK